jgi:hypothetical protein
MPTVKVSPVRGSGWVVGGELREDVPGPFTVALQSSEPKRWSGIVLDSGHESQGKRVSLLLLEAEWTGDVEIVIELSRAASDLATGYGVVNHEPRSLP